MLGALRFGKTAVERDHRRARQTRPHPFFQLRGEVDFRHQHQGLPSGVHHVGDQVQVHLRLAAACDPVKQPRVVAVQAGPDRACHGLLFLGEGKQSGGGGCAARPPGLGPALGQALRQQAGHGLGPTGGEPARLGFVEAAGRQQAEGEATRNHLARRHGFNAGAGKPCGREIPSPVLQAQGTGPARAGGQRGGHHLADGVVVVAVAKAQ